MKEYIIAKKNVDLDWNQIEAAPIDCCLWIPPAEVSAEARVCYDADAVYVQLRAKEKHIRAEETGPVGMPCLDSCLEFFFCPIPENRTYFNIEMNPNRCLYLGIGTDRYDGIRLLPHGENFLNAEVTRDPEGWSVSYIVPISFIQRFFPDFRAESGRKIRGNFFKCGDYTVKPHYYAWNPIELEKPDFHRSEFFGTMIFE